jgi:hypothetical protein
MHKCERGILSRDRFLGEPVTNLLSFLARGTSLRNDLKRRDSSYYIFGMKLCETLEVYVT